MPLARGRAIGERGTHPFLAVMPTKKELWVAVHREKIACPGCQKVMSRRAIRWRHKCRGMGPKLLDDAEAEQRRERYVEQAILGFQERH